MKREYRKISILLVLAMLVQIFLPLPSSKSYSAGKATVIDRLSLEKNGRLNGNIAYDLKADWSIEDYAWREGDSFSISLARDLDFTSPQNTVYLNSPDGRLYARGHIDKASKNIEFIFTDLVEKEKNIHGSFWIYGLTTKTNERGKGIISRPGRISENGQSIWEGILEIDTGSISHQTGSSHYPFNFRKNPQPGSILGPNNISYGEDGSLILQWMIDINTTRDKKYEGELIVRDKLEGSQFIDESSFELQYYKTDEEGNRIVDSYREGLEAINTFENSGERVKYLNIGEDRKSFELSMDVNKSNSYILWYKTKVSLEDFINDSEEGIKSYKNHAYLVHNGRDIESSTGQYDFSQIGGIAIGELVNNSTRGKVKLIKEDEEGNKLEGAIVNIDKYSLDGKNLESIEENISLGEYSKEDLESGLYRISETESPDGYKRLERPLIKLLDFEKINTLIRDFEKLEKDIRIYKEVIKDLEVSSEELVDYETYLKFYEAEPNLANSINNRPRGWALEQVKRRYKESKLEEKVQILRNKLEEMDYSFKDKAIVIRIENKKNTKDLALIKNWEISQEYRDELDGIGADFKLEAYKLLGEEPVKLAEGELSSFLDKTYSLSFDKNSDTSTLTIKDLPYSDEEGNYYVYSLIEKDLEEFKSTGYKEIRLVDYEEEDRARVEFTNIHQPKPRADLTIEKVDRDDKNIKLEGAIFTLNKDNIDLGEVETDKDGLASFEKLKEGKYILRERKAPEGYLIDIEEIELEIKDGKVFILGEELVGNLLIENSRDKSLDTRSLTIRKEWQDLDGNVINENYIGQQVSVELYYRIENKVLDFEKYPYEAGAYSNNDGGVILNSDMDWKYSFTDLPIKDEEGNLYEYGIREIGLPGFISSVHGTMDDEEIVILNRSNDMTISLNRICMEDDEEIVCSQEVAMKVYLKDGDKIVKEVLLDSCNAQGLELKDIPRYRMDKDGYIILDEDGNPIEIPYGIELMALGMDFDYSISGNPSDGFTIVSKHKQVEVPETPEKPEEPEEPEVPEEPEAPEEPEIPELPVVPEEPEVPEIPEEPKEPETPKEPELPVVPEEPELPEQPEEPEEPKLPEQPEKPIIPEAEVELPIEEPERPIEPEGPMGPEDLDGEGQVESPEDLEEPKEPVDPNIPEEPVIVDPVEPEEPFIPEEDKVDKEIEEEDGASINLGNNGGNFYPDIAGDVNVGSNSEDSFNGDIAGIFTDKQVKEQNKNKGDLLGNSLKLPKTGMDNSLYIILSLLFMGLGLYFKKKIY